MQYYQFHIGDYAQATAHLTPLEDIAYRRLLDLYYSLESPIPCDISLVSRKIRLEKEPVEQVLNEFFVLTNDGYRHHRCDAELDAIYSKSGKARKSAEMRWERHRNANAMRTHTERNANGMLPITHNPIPITKNKPISEQAVEVSILPPATPSAATNSARGTRLPADWKLPKAWGEWAMQENSGWSDDDVRRCADKFHNHWIAATGRTATKANWQATWRNWVRKEEAPPRQARPQSRHSGFDKVDYKAGVLPDGRF